MEKTTNSQEKKSPGIWMKQAVSKENLFQVVQPNTVTHILWKTMNGTDISIIVLKEAFL